MLVAPKFSRSYMAKFQGHTDQKIPSETGQIKGFRAFSGVRMGEGPEIPYAAVSWPPN